MDRAQKKQDATAGRRLAKIQKGRRATQFVTKTILQILFFGLLCAAAFIYCSRLAASYLLTHEGMAKRADYIMGKADMQDITLYFSDGCIAADSKLNAGTYAGYTIADFGYSIQITSVRVAPWDMQPYVEVIEQIKNIRGDPNTEGDPSSPPEWTTLRYRIYFGSVRGRWMITGIRIAEHAPEVPPPATPDPNMEPIPMITASPAPE